MHGVIFTSLRDYLAATYGEGRAVEIFEGEPVYLLSEAYPDERLHSLLARAAAMVGRDPGNLLEDFGAFTAEVTFARLYPGAFAASDGTRDFLLTVESRIHELVRATVPQARPPQLLVTELGPDSVQILYTSPRQLCRLLRGLATGAARSYGEDVRIEERECMLRGDPLCRLELTLTPSA